MYDHELKTFIQAILTDTISPSQLLERLIHTIDWTKIYESEDQLTTDAFFALKLQISPKRCDDFASGGVSISVSPVGAFRINGAFGSCV